MDTTWKTINVNLNQIEVETDKAFLINMPNNSAYSGYHFWHPAKLVRRGRHSFAVALSFNDNFKFKLFKNGKGKYNKFEIINEIELNAEELEDAFKTTDENIISRKN